MNNLETTVGIAVAIIQIGILLYAVYKVRQYEKEKPTEEVIPE
jgi:hypothetical protein